MKLLPCGDRAVLVEFDSLEAALEAHVIWSTAPPVGLIELVPAARTVLVRINPAVLGLGAVAQWLTACLPAGGASGRTPGARGGLALGLAALDAPPVAIAVVHDGDDLEFVADTWGCSPAAVAERHSAIEWVCGFIGFAPGFSYLVPAPSTPALPPVPRRATSRPQVPAGSVALAAEYCGVYPRSSPGGWQLIGRTAAVLWDADRASPALITAGARVRFDPVRG